MWPEAGAHQGKGWRAGEEASHAAWEQSMCVRTVRGTRASCERADAYAVTTRAGSPLSAQKAGNVCVDSCGLAGRGQLASTVCRTVAHGSQGVCVQAACPGCARSRALQSGSVCGCMDGGRV